MGRKEGGKDYVGRSVERMLRREQQRLKLELKVDALVEMCVGWLDGGRGRSEQET